MSDSDPWGRKAQAVRDLIRMHGGRVGIRHAGSPTVVRESWVELGVFGMPNPMRSP